MSLRAEGEAISSYPNYEIDMSPMGHLAMTLETEITKEEKGAKHVC